LPCPVPLPPFSDLGRRERHRSGRHDQVRQVNQHRAGALESAERTVAARTHRHQHDVACGLHERGRDLARVAGADDRYRIGHAVVLERFFALIEQLSLPPAQRHSGTLIGSKVPVRLCGSRRGRDLRGVRRRTSASTAQQHPASRTTRARRSRRDEHRQRRTRLSPRTRASRGRRHRPGRRRIPARPGARRGSLTGQIHDVAGQPRTGTNVVWPAGILGGLRPERGAATVRAVSGRDGGLIRADGSRLPVTGEGCFRLRAAYAAGCPVVTKSLPRIAGRRRVAANLTGRDGAR